MYNEKIELLKSVDNYLFNLINGIEKFIMSLKSGNEIDGISNLPYILDGIEYVSKAITLTNDVQKNEIQLDDLNIQLKEIIEAFENEDYILVGDLFNYELLPIIRNFHKNIKLSLE